MTEGPPKWKYANLQGKNVRCHGVSKAYKDNNSQDKAILFLDTVFELVWVVPGIPRFTSLILDVPTKQFVEKPWLFHAFARCPETPPSVQGNSTSAIGTAS